MTMLRKKVGSVAFAGLLALGGLGAVACDNEDQKDAEEIGNDIQEGVEEGVNEVEEGVDEVEEEIDEKVDTDGTDDQ